MFRSNASRRRIARTLSTLVALALTAAAGGLSANGAAATTAETPQNVTAASTTQADNTGTVVVNWDALLNPDSVSAIDISLTGQSSQSVPSGTNGVEFSGVAPGDYAGAVAFEYTDSSPTSADVAFAVTVLPVAAPDPVSDVHGSSDGTDVTVSWTPAQDVGGNPTGAPYDHYTVTLGAEAPADVPAGNSDRLFIGIAPSAVAYDITVGVVNAAGTTETHGSVLVTGSVPDAPEDVAATSTDLDSVAVTWAPPASDGGQPVDKYDVTLEDDVASTEDAVTATDGAGRGVTFDGLDAGSYTAVVTAHNSNGSSESGSALVIVGDSWTGSGQAAPTHLRATRVTEGGFTTIKWRAPEGVGLYLMFVDGRPYLVRPRKIEKTVHGLRAGPAKVKLFALSENGFSRPAVIKIYVKKSVAQAPKVTLKLGMHGPDVTRLQKALFMRHSSGVFGKGTRAAVIEWQGFYGKHRTGEVNDRMRYLLNV